jgi:hypothetical protein
VLFSRPRRETQFLLRERLGLGELAEFANTSDVDTRTPPCSCGSGFGSSMPTVRTRC